MNVTELARILKITPKELRDNLPQLGFDIGRKAIKINRNVANKIIKDWPNLRKKIEKIKEEEERLEEEKKKEERKEIVKKISVPKYITVKNFSNLSGAPANQILAELMKNGIFASLNEKIDSETAWLVGSELGIEVTQKKEGEDSGDERNKLKNILAKEKKLDFRPPVIVVMGHVDHGKTKLLDSIRRTNVVDGEAGGITQHIGAYQTTRKNKLLTFIDTPGHEAFTAMRSRGTKIADIAILVVAADDGVKPQTTEAFRIIEAAKIPYIVAINKIDKPEANIDKTKQELSSQLNISPEDWGGKTICVPISAKDGTGIDDLLDTIILIADTEAENIKANPNSFGVGTVIESHIDKGAGPIATILIQNGTVKVGDQLTLNNVVVGKIRSLKNYLFQDIESAPPSVPAQIMGLKTAPQVGDILEVGEGERMKGKKSKGVAKPELFEQKETDTEEGKVKKINLIIKSDVLGSAEAIEESLEKINTPVVKTKIIFKGLGNITDGDIKKAEASHGKIVGFNVKIPPQIEELAREKNVEIKLYSIIYDLINDVKEEMQSILEPVIKKIDLGKLKVKAIFKTEKEGQIIGGKITEGKAEKDALIKILRNKEEIGNGKIAKLQAGKQDVVEVEVGQECGIEFTGNPVIQAGDSLHLYKEEKIFGKIE